MTKEKNTADNVGISDSLSEREKAKLGKHSTDYLHKKFEYVTNPKYDMNNPSPYQMHVAKNSKRVPEYVGSKALERNPELQEIVTRDEAIAIAHYTGEGYSEINGLFDKNGKLRENIDTKYKDKGAYSVAVTLDSALKKLQDHKKDREPSTSYRYHQPHSKPEVESIKGHEDYTSKGFMSSTSHRGNKKVKKEFLDDKQTYQEPIKFAITSTSGVSVEQFSHKPGEGEILFRPGVQFEVGEVKPGGYGKILNRNQPSRLNVELTEKERELQPPSQEKKTSQVLTELQSNGEQYTVKKVKSDEHARNEVLASKLYEELGVTVPQTSLYKPKGSKKLQVASKNTEGLETRDLHNQTHSDSGLYEGFIADAFLSNFEIAESSSDKIKFDKNGQAVRLDSSAALQYKADGKSKEGLFQGYVRDKEKILEYNPQYAEIFTDERLDQKALAKGFEKLEALTDDRLHEIVQEHGPKTQEDKKEMFLKLAERKDNLVKQKNKLLGIEEVKETEKTESSTKWQDKENQRTAQRQNSRDSSSDGSYIGFLG